MEFHKKTSNSHKYEASKQTPASRTSNELMVPITYKLYYYYYSIIHL